MQESSPSQPAAQQPAAQQPAVQQDQQVKPVIPAAAAKRANASVIGMILALAVSILAFLPVVLMNPAPDSDDFVSKVDVNAAAGYAKDVAGFTPATPDTNGSYRSNYARWESGTSDGVPTWEVGYLTPAGSFVGLVQTRASNPTWLADITANAPVTGTRDAGGHAWELRDSGKGEKNMILNHKGTTVVLSGPASLDEFSTLAAAVVTSMDAATDVTVAPSSPAAQ